MKSNPRCALFAFENLLHAIARKRAAEGRETRAFHAVGKEKLETRADTVVEFHLHRIARHSAGAMKPDVHDRDGGPKKTAARAVAKLVIEALNNVFVAALFVAFVGLDWRNRAVFEQAHSEGREGSAFFEGGLGLR